MLWDAVSTACQSSDPMDIFKPFIDSFVDQLQRDALTK
jgi:hypothetical protein